MPSLLPLQDKFSIHCHQFKLSPGQLPAMSTISAIAHFTDIGRHIE